MKKKLSSQVYSSNEAMRVLKEQVAEKDKELSSKVDQIAKLKAKIASIKIAQHARNDSLQAPKQDSARRNSGLS